MSIKEFTKAAGRYESSHAGIYEMCKKDYPDPQAFFDSVKRCLRPNGRLVLRDVTSDNKVLVWLMNTLEMPLANICGHGDVQVPTELIPEMSGTVEYVALDLMMNVALG